MACSRSLRAAASFGAALAMRANTERSDDTATAAATITIERRTRRALRIKVSSRFLRRRLCSARFTYS